MRKTASVLAVLLASSALTLLPVGGASAHVHGINPLRCTPAADNDAGAIRAVETRAGAEGGPLFEVGVIPIAMGGAVVARPLEFFGVCRNAS